MMKTKWIALPSGQFLKAFFLLIWSGLLSCDYEVVPDQFVVGPGNRPTACFTSSAESCTLPDCAISFSAACSEEAVRFEWDFDGDGLSDQSGADKEITEFQYMQAGEYSVRLIVADDKSMKDTTFRTITVNPEDIPEYTRFEKSVDLGSGDVFPIGITETDAGDYHLLYRLSDGSIKSVFLDSDGEVKGVPEDIPLAMALNYAQAYRGGFLISGSSTGTGNTGKLIVGIVDEDQELSMSQEARFGGDASSGQGLVLNLNGELAVTGLRVDPQPFFPGFGRFSSNGVIITNPVAVSHSTLEGYSGLSLVQRSDNKYFITLNPLPATGRNARLLRVTANGGYEDSYSLSPLNTSRKIINMGSDYAIIGKTEAGAKYVLGVNNNGSMIWDRQASVNELDDIIYDDKEDVLLLCGSQLGGLYWSKIPPNDTESIIWENKAEGANGDIRGVSISLASDGGYLILGRYDNDGTSEAFLVKTDPDGLSK